MTGKTHVGIGVMSAVILSQYIPMDLTVSALSVSALAALLPDVDHPKSIINKYILPFKSKGAKVTFYFMLGIFVIAVNSFYFSYSHLNALGVFFIFIGASNHRNGTTHSLTGFLCFLFTIGYIMVKIRCGNLIVPFSIGYLSHLSADMFTSKGIPLFYPFSKKKFKMPITFTVGSFWGKMIESIITAGGLIYLTYKLPIIMMKMR
ncbi:inner membrane protein [Caloramator quimbayensis]|uniref:Inner membrane protein n=1 Tax=Caloramator quimbayensis TaxID=1147123 RepID=A0A1T4YAD0_9CLOT|nr:metal-dependent hydrolase [Caloramator quimbayensis]SKA98478.1 inner membrane protein [Caloramator quimbayensis]